ncbi:MAG TPA: LLM class flavin-dependent oxidoreductase [Candidatus Syntrophoarchaeum butanivorans]|uniref:LLM class flavin-dependent oxidoreductase n=1 Tax=Candidatus Syntropharchaeum butanivorans TaxID=1839936 RepID=A0A7C0X5D6_9EURY|nr:LLM class flavin-dependent oxidoreductase [Candidatus Syntrophoarchaeum butanivorans]
MADEKDPLRFGIEVTIVPRERDFIARAESTGFDSIWIDDHLLPWSDKDGKRFPYTTPMAWAIMPLMLEWTRSIAVGSAVTCPLLRYHPAIVAQYFAQLDHLYPGRVLLGIGTGERINEGSIGEWPPYRERRARLIEAVEIIRLLWEREDYFNYRGEYYRINNAHLFVRPRERIPLIISAAGPRSSRLAGEIGDGVMILSGTPDEVKSLIESFKKGAESCGKDPQRMDRVMYLFGGVVPEEVFSKVLRGFKRSVVWLLPEVLDVQDPREIDELSKKIPDEEVRSKCLFYENVEDLISAFERYHDAGINRIIFGDFTSLFKGKPLEIDAMWHDTILPHFKEDGGV